MNAQAVVARRPCGCVAHVLPSFRVKEDCGGLEANGMSVEVIPFEGAGLKKCGPCEHGSTQQQLAALVKKQAGEIEGYKTALADPRAVYVNMLCGTIAMLPEVENYPALLAEAVELRALIASGIPGHCHTAGDDEDGEPRMIIQTTRDALMKTAVAARDVIVIPKDTHE